MMFKKYYLTLTSLFLYAHFVYATPPANTAKPKQKQLTLEEAFGIKKKSITKKKPKKLRQISLYEAFKISDPQPSNTSSSTMSPSSTQTLRTPQKQPRIVLFKTPQKTTFATNITHDFEKSIHEILKSKEKLQDNEVEIYINSFFFTNQNIAQTLVDLKKELNEKVSIVILIDQMSQYWFDKKVVDILMPYDIPVYVYESNFFERTDNPLHLSHAKYMVWKYKSEKNRPLYRLVSGSTNFTVLATKADNNFEQFMITKISKQDFDQYKRLLFNAAQNAKQINPNATDIRPESVEPILPNAMLKTPQKGHTTQFSPTDNIIEAMVKRIDKTKTGGEITIITYAFDVPLVTEALLRALTRDVKVWIVMDQYGLKRKESEETTKEQLSNLTQAGAQVFIYKRSNSALKNHAKLLLINDGKRIVCGHGSYNFTPTSKTSYNTFHWLARTASAAALNSIVEQWPQLMQHSEKFQPTISPTNEKDEAMSDIPSSSDSEKSEHEVIFTPASQNSTDDIASSNSDPDPSDENPNKHDSISNPSNDDEEMTEPESYPDFDIPLSPKPPKNIKPNRKLFFD